MPPRGREAGRGRIGLELGILSDCDARRERRGRGRGHYLEFLNGRQMQRWNALLRSPRLWTAILIVAAIALTFHPVVFGDFTFSNSTPARGVGPVYAESGLPLRDPAAGANQDESWLVFIRSSLASGDLPLVNMSNGMGAPVVETLQPGVFYLANPVLLLFDPTTPRFFDAFALLHVLLFVAGLYALLRLYAGRSASLSLAILVGLSGMTTENINMVHFRCHAWFPLVLYGAIRMARGDKSRWPFFVFVVAHAAQITCGALQEAFVCSLVTGAVFLVELWCAREPDAPRARGLTRMSLAAVCSTAIGAVSVLPYLFARGSGDIVTASNPDRSIAHATAVELSNVVFPNAVGFYPHFFTNGMPDQWLTDFSTLGTYLFVAGSVALLVAHSSVPRGRLRWAALSLLVVIGAAKLAGLPAFDFLRDVPFVCEILFIKYHSWIYTLSAVVAAAGCDALMSMDRKHARRVVFVTLVATLLLVWRLLSLVWTRPLEDLLAGLPETTVRDVAWCYGTSAAALLAGAVLLWVRPRGALAFLGVVTIAHSVLVLPNGWFPRAPRYQDTIERQELADPTLVEPGGLDLQPRIFSSYQPNQNLIAGFENLGVFDPVSNTRFSRLLGETFRLQHPLFDLQPITEGDERLTRTQANILRILGVSRIYGYPVGIETSMKRTPGGGWLVGYPLPRVWLLSKADADRLDQPLEHETARAMLKYTTLAVRPYSEILEVHSAAHGFDISVTQDFQGELVVQQAYARAWEFEGESGRPYCDIFPRWSVDLRRGHTYHVRYEPLGFRLGLAISAGGVLLAILSGLFLLRRI